MSEVFSNKLSLGLSAGLFTLACLIISLDLFQLPDNWLADRQLKLYAKQLNPANDIVVIDIDDESIEKISMFAGFWPWPRSVHAELIAGISPHHPKAIVFDILFSEADRFRPDSDSYFNEVIAEHRNIYFSLLHLTSSENNTGELIKNQPPSAGISATASAQENARAHLLLPKAINPQHWLIGSINFTPDSDGVGRRYDIYRDIQGWRIPSLPAKVASDLGATLPDQASIILQWKRYKNSTLTTYSYADIYQSILENNQLLLSQLANKIIIIGSTASGLHDIRETPVSHQHPAVYILATAIDNLLRGQFLSPTHPVINWLLSLMIIGLISAAFLSRLNFKSQLLLAGVIITTTSSALLLSSYLVLRYGIQAKVATPITLGIISYIFFALLHGLQEHFERRQAITLFSRFVDPKVVSKLIKDKTLDIEKAANRLP